MTLLYESHLQLSLLQNDSILSLSQLRAVVSKLLNLFNNRSRLQNSINLNRVLLEQFKLYFI